MSTILYYSNFCEHSRKLLQTFSKTNVKNDMHFICIDKRVKDNNKTFIVLENGNKILMPDNITRVPALLLLTQGYNVLYGDAILEHFRPVQQKMVKQATQNNMEPMAFSFGGGGGFSDVVSDQYSFLDMDAEALKATGDGGMRQMHNYVDLNTAFSGNVSNVETNDNFNTTIRGSKKMGEDVSNQQMEQRLKKMQEDRDADIRSINGNRPPMTF
jgi:hypothetical protein